MFFRGKWKWTFEMKAAVFLWILALVVDIFINTILSLSLAETHLL